MSAELTGARRGVELAALAGLPGVQDCEVPGEPSFGLPREEVAGDQDRSQGLLRIDSRLCAPGDLFIALRGTLRDGHEFVEQLLERGVHCAVEGPGAPSQAAGGLIRVRDTREFLARIAALAAGLPGSGLKVTGVTGTNGKTSCTWILQRLLLALDASTGLCGTICSRVGDTGGRPARLTTPDPLWLAAFAREVLDKGGIHLVMEVSSHAVDQRREALFGFRGGVFLNLSPEHLDYHGDMESYFRVKASFMRRPEMAFRLVFTDDPWGARLAEELDPLPCITFGRSGSVDWRITGEEPAAEGMRLRLAGPAGEREYRLPLFGAHNAVNAAAAIIAARELGLDAGSAAEGLSRLDPIPGRLERARVGTAGKEAARVSAGHPLVLIDYAHSPDGFRKVFAASRGLAAGGIHAVFGCGGERDRAKRPEMLGIALKECERVWITTDNPRGEDPERIFADMRGRAERADLDRVTRIDDRAAAIRDAVEVCGPRDLLLLLGKGHERWQYVGGRRIPFDEREVLASIGGGDPT